MPTAAETEGLWELEDRLFEMFAKDRRAIVVAVITTSGMREFVLYAHDPIEVGARHLQLQAQLPDHEIQLTVQPDPGWATFGLFR